MIQKGAFMHCKNLTIANINGTYTQLSEQCFKYDENLTVVYLPQSFESSPLSSFANCSSIQCVTYSKNMKERVFMAGIPWVALSDTNCSKYLPAIERRHQEYQKWIQNIFRYRY